MHQNHEPDAPPRRWRTWLRCERGAVAIEYGLILAVVVVALLGALLSLKDAVTGQYTRIGDAVTSAGR